MKNILEIDSGEGVLNATEFCAVKKKVNEEEQDVEC